MIHTSAVNPDLLTEQIQAQVVRGWRGRWRIVISQQFALHDLLALDPLEMEPHYAILKHWIRNAPVLDVAVLEERLVDMVVVKSHVLCDHYLPVAISYFPFGTRCDLISSQQHSLLVTDFRTAKISERT